MNILIKKGLFFRHSVDIISTCYIYKNRRKCSRNFILFNFLFFVDLHLQIIESISSKASVENSSAQWAIFFNFFFIKLRKKHTVLYPSRCCIIFCSNLGVEKKRKKKY